MNSEQYIILAVLFFCSFTIIAQEKEVTKTPLIIGEYVSINSKILDEDRKLNIYLPLGY